MREITVELTSVHNVTEQNFDDVVKKLDELYGVELRKEMGDDYNMWPSGLSLEEQHKNINESNDKIFFFKLRKPVEA